MTTQATSAPNMFIPGRCSFDNWCFSGVPTTLTAFDVANSEFEFETTRHFQHELEKTDSLLDKELAPVMAFADELFCNGTVMPLTLRLPPRLRCINGNGSPVSPMRSPRSPTHKLKILFKCQSLSCDDFDPFMVALKNVKEKNEGKFEENIQEWAQPMSPIWAANPQRSSNDNGLQAHQSGPMEKQSPVIDLAEPKGVFLARQARLEKMAYENSNKHNTGKSKMQKIKKFIFRTISVDRTRINEEQQKDENAVVTKPEKSNNFKSIAVAENNENERGPESETTKMALIPSRPKSLFLCMSYGAKFAN